MNSVTYPAHDVTPVDALWVLIQGQTKSVRAALTKRLVEQQRTNKLVSREAVSDFTNRIKALENDSEGFFKLGGFMADSKSTAEELLDEAYDDKYGI